MEIARFLGFSNLSTHPSQQQPWSSTHNNIQSKPHREKFGRRTKKSLMRLSLESRPILGGVTRSVQYRTLVHCENPPRVRAIARARAIFRTKSVSSIISRWVSRIGTRGPPLRVPRGRGVPTETSTEGFVPNVVVSESGVPLGRRYDDVKN